MRSKNMAMIIFALIFSVCAPFAIYQMKGYRIISGLKSFNEITSHHEMMCVTVIFMIVLTLTLIYPIISKYKKRKKCLIEDDLSLNVTIAKNGVKSKVYLWREK